VKRLLLTLLTFCAVLLLTLSALAQEGNGLPSHSELQEALRAVVQEENGGFGLHMWATIVDRDGMARLVVFSGEERGDQFPASRIISAQKANTANGLSLPGLALSTANLYTGVQPGGSLYGLQFSNPMNTVVAYQGDAEDFGTENDPMVGERIGGINVFGGGLALYNSDSEVVGGLGVSGDSSCADHNIAWKLRHTLSLDYLPGGVSPTGDDNIVYDIAAGQSQAGWGHPECSPEATQIAEELPESHPLRLPGDAQAIEPEAERYLSSALSILERNFVRREQVDWEAIRAAAFDLASNAVTAEDTYPAIELALEMMGERHSRFIPAEEATTPPASYIGIGVSFSPSFTVLSVLPGGGAEAAGILPGDTILAVNGEPFVSTMQILGLPEDETAIEITFRRGDGGEPQTLTVERRRFSTNLPPTGQRLENRIGYVQLPAHSGSGTFDDGRDYATITQRLIEEIDGEETCGWVVDLRRNAGGNLWPMLAGIGPILGEGEVGGSVRSDSTTPWRYERGRALASDSTRFRTSINYSLRQADPLVAVITSGSTASSGEAIVVAFKGRPDTRFFGEATNGIPTSNIGFPLSDGAVLNLTVGFMADRTGQTYDAPIEPDEAIEVDWERIGTDDDPVLEAALVWLNAQEACQP
jgi:C-terminal processing protease CtpA/Prc/uncharacterized protein GlcG (DUF336 family)